MDANVYRSAPAARRFSISVPRLKPWWKVVLVAALVAAFIALGNLVPGSLIVVVLVAFFAGLALVFASGRRRLPIDVGPAGLAIDGGRRGTFGLEGAKFSRWNHPHYKCAAGVALHLVGPNGRHYRVGGRDVRAWPDALPETDEVVAVDGYLSREDFAELLAALDPRFAPAPEPTTLRVPLMENTVPYVHRRRSSPSAVVGFLEVDAAAVRVLDEAGALRVTAPLASLSPERTAHVYPGRDLGFTMAGLILRVPKLDPIFIGVPDPRFRWRDGARSAGEPLFQLGSPDWRALVERLGLADALEVLPDPP